MIPNNASTFITNIHFIAIRARVQSVRVRSHSDARAGANTHTHARPEICATRFPRAQSAHNAHTQRVYTHMKSPWWMRPIRPCSRAARPKPHEMHTHSTVSSPTSITHIMWYIRSAGAPAPIPVLHTHTQKRSSQCVCGVFAPRTRARAYTIVN